MQWTNEMAFWSIFTLNCYVKTKGEGIYNNLRLLYLQATLMKLGTIMALPTLSNSFSFNGEILTTFDLKNL